MQTDIQTETPADTFSPVAAPWHTLGIVAIIAVLALRGRLQVEQLRAMANSGHISLYQRTIFTEWLVLALVLAGVWLHGSSLFIVLGDRWRSVRQFLRDVGIALVFLVITIVVTSVLGSHGGAGQSAARFLLPQGRTETGLWIVLSITAGICEEAVYRGYLQKQFMALTRSVPAGILLSALAFGLAHSYQGFGPASVIGVMGAMGGVLAYWCRSVRPGMIAHTLQDVLGAFVRH